MSSKQRLNLKDFQVLKELKGNSSNQIFLVRNPSGKRVIFKRIRIHNFTAQLREIQAQKNLHHRYIVRLLDYEIQHEYIVLIIELAEEGDLFEFINNIDSIRESKLLRLFYKIVIGVHFIHLNGFIHRDIKPENILIGNGEPKMADFGSSVAESVVRNTFCGTYEYMAPEIYMRRAQTAKVDVWALGVLLFEMTHNRTPFKGKDVAQIRKIVEGKRIDFDKQISSKIRRIICQLLRFRAEDRPTTAQVLKLPELKRFYEEMKPELLAIYQDKTILKLRKIRSCNKGFGEERGYRHMKTANALPNLKAPRIIRDKEMELSNVPKSFQKLEDCERDMKKKNGKNNTSMKAGLASKIESRKDAKSKKRVEPKVIKSEIQNENQKPKPKKDEVKKKPISKKAIKSKPGKSITSQIMQKAGEDTQQIKIGFEKVMGTTTESQKQSKQSKQSKVSKQSQGNNPNLNNNKRNKKNSSNTTSQTDNRYFKKSKHARMKSSNRVKSKLSYSRGSGKSNSLARTNLKNKPLNSKKFKRILKNSSLVKLAKYGSMTDTNHNLQFANWGLQSQKPAKSKYLLDLRSNNGLKPKTGLKMNSMVCMQMKSQGLKKEEKSKLSPLTGPKTRPYLGVGSMQSLFESRKRRQQFLKGNKMRCLQGKIKERLRVYRLAKSKEQTPTKSIDKDSAHNLAFQFGPKSNQDSPGLKNISHKLFSKLHSSKNMKNVESPNILFDPSAKHSKLGSTEDSDRGRYDSQPGRVVGMQQSHRQIRQNIIINAESQFQSNKRIKKWVGQSGSTRGERIETDLLFMGK